MAFISIPHRPLLCATVSCVCIFHSFGRIPELMLGVSNTRACASEPASALTSCDFDGNTDAGGVVIAFSKTVSLHGSSIHNACLSFLVRISSSSPIKYVLMGSDVGLEVRCCPYPYTVNLLQILFLDRRGCLSYVYLCLPAPTFTSILTYEIVAACCTHPLDLAKV